MVRYAAPPTPPLCDNLILTASTGPQTRPGDTSGADLHASDGDQSTTGHHTPDQTGTSISQAQTGGGPEVTPSSSNADYTVEDSNEQGDRDKHSEGTPSPYPSDIDTDSRIEHESDATETEDAYNDQNGEPSPEPGVSEASERERESSTEEVSDDDVEREKVRAKEQYMNELQEQREKLLHQQTLERQQQQWQEERDDASGGESKPAQRTSGKTLLDKERERLLQQQQQQQQQQEGHVEERGNRQSQINVESVTNSQQSLYDSGREEQPENADRGIRESGEDGDSGEKGRDGGTPGARGEGGDLGAGGEDVRWEREGEGESEDRTCDSQTPGDCPEIKDGIYYMNLQFTKINPDPFFCGNHKLNLFISLSLI